MKKLSLFFLLIGVGLLGYLVYDVGAAKLWSQLVHVGPRFVFVLAVGLTSLVFLAAAWKELLYPERSTARVYDLATAGIIGFAINEVTPGSIAGEPVKAAQLRDKVPDEDLVSSLILHNYLYIITNFLQIAIGAMIGLIWLDLPPILFIGTIVTTIGVAIFLVMMALAIRWGMAERFVRALRWACTHIPGLRRIDVSNFESAIDKARKADKQARSFYSERRGAFLRAFGWIFLARAMAVVEIWVILLLIGQPAGFATLMLLQASSLLVYVIFFFVPSQMGANELGSKVIFDLLRLGGHVGIYMEIIRRLRKISIAVIGLCILGIRTLASGRRAALSKTIEAPPPGDS